MDAYLLFEGVYGVFLFWSRYIQRFRRPQALTGEFSYFFTTVIEKASSTLRDVYIVCCHQIVCHTSHLTLYTSHLTPHTSHFTPHSHPIGLRFHHLMTTSISATIRTKTHPIQRLSTTFGMQAEEHGPGSKLSTLWSSITAFGVRLLIVRGPTWSMQESTVCSAGSQGPASQVNIFIAQTCE